jgi:hypothetical protein
MVLAVSAGMVWRDFNVAGGFGDLLGARRNVDNRRNRIRDRIRGFRGGNHKPSVSSQKRQFANTEEIQSKAVSDILHVAATRDSLIELLNYSLDRFLEIMSLNSGAIHIHHAARNTLVMGAYRGLSPLYANKLELIRPGQTAIGALCKIGAY